MRLSRTARPLVGLLLAGCYGILAVVATGPHAHAGGAAPLHAALSGPSWVPEQRPEEGGRGPEGPSSCRLCSWIRTIARSERAAATGEMDPPALPIGPRTPVEPAGDPLLLHPLLRAPPAA